MAYRDKQTYVVTAGEDLLFQYNEFVGFHSWVTIAINLNIKSVYEYEDKTEKFQSRKRNEKYTTREIYVDTNIKIIEETEKLSIHL